MDFALAEDDQGVYIVILLARPEEAQALREAVLLPAVEALAAALDKIHRYARGLPMATAEQHPETAQMMIINPLTTDGIKSLFSTHPATEERVARLMAMVRGVA